MKQYDSQYVTSFTEQEDTVNKVIVLLEDISKESRFSAAPNGRVAALANATIEQLQLMKTIVRELRAQKAKDSK